MSLASQLSAGFGSGTFPISKPFWGNDIPTEFVGLPVGYRPELQDWFPSWNKVFYGADNNVLPGKAVVHCHKTHRVDKKSAPGQDGATLTHLGYDLAAIEITLTMWLPAQWQAWVTEVVPVLQPKHPTPLKGATDAGGPEPIQIIHPALAAHQIASLYVLDLGIPEPRGHEPDIYEVRIVGSEWSPTRKKNVSSTKRQLDLRSKKKAINFTPTAQDPATTPSATDSGLDTQ